MYLRKHPHATNNYLKSHNKLMHWSANSRAQWLWRYTGSLSAGKETSVWDIITTWYIEDNQLKTDLRGPWKCTLHHIIERNPASCITRRSSGKINSITFGEFDRLRDIITTTAFRRFCRSTKLLYRKPVGRKGNERMRHNNHLIYRR